MAGGIASTLLEAAARRRGSTASSACSRSTSCGSPQLAAGAAPARAAARQPVPRPARPLRRAGDDRRALGRGRRRAAGRDAAGAERRRPARRRPRPRARATSRTSASRTTRWRCRRCSTRPTRSTAAAAAHAYAYEAVYLGHLGRYRCPQCGQRAPARRTSSPTRRARCNGTRDARSRCAIAEPARRRVALPLPGLYNVYNALGAAALCHALGVPLDEIVAGLGAVAAAFGRAETIALDGRALSILLIKNPAGANEVLRTLALEDGRARPARGAQRQRRRRARRLVGVGRRLRAARRARAADHVRRHARGASWRCG